MALERIAVVGAGAWGTALANASARAGRGVTLIARQESAAAAMRQSRESLQSSLKSIQLLWTIRPPCRCPTTMRPF